MNIELVEKLAFELMDGKTPDTSVLTDEEKSHMCFVVGLMTVDKVAKSLKYAGAMTEYDQQFTDGVDYALEMLAEQTHE